ncbi:MULTISPECIES: sortase [unclassified Curtobacterium]|uniref:sortase n=1 Tax=unclassified Curtobacterium TaxID=257496 RepID=UPI000DA8698C|nr:MULTISPECIES: sortase [unclassified Curtobacterium]PZE27893.1 sortase [Curtobacterium sp. MCBD17_028]PZE78337.1 sortase [Curtobacterium sp. MCBD17_019]WIB64152.1 sortase [Curtobacterium sp. MCBD17_040]WIE55173.1 sortase [Curtobacterium sp. MCBD17_003]
MKKTIAALVLAGAAVMAAPMAANAEGYVPASNVSVSGSVVAGGTTIINFAPGSFADSENVTISVTGAGAVTIGALPTQTVTAVRQASATGSLNAPITLPRGASGTYEVTATGVTSGNIATTALTVVPAAATGTGATVTATSTGTGLAFTGSTVPTLLVWSAGGAVVLGGALVGVTAATRRQRKNV